MEELVPDTSRSIRREDMERAKALLIERQETHLDSLAERLQDPRVRAILEPMLAGSFPGSLPPGDVRFVINLGLIRLTPAGGLEVANPIYREILVR